MTASKNRSGPIVVVGPPAAGKTTVGTLLAERLGVPFADSDDLIEREHGTIADIFAEQGEAGFREFEHAAIAEALRSDVGVLALGGGAVMHEGTYKLLSEHPHIVALSVNPEDAMNRIGDTTHRPLLHTAPHAGRMSDRNTERQTWEALVAPRLARYHALAKLEIDTDKRTPDAIVADIVQWLNTADFTQADFTDESGRKA